MRFIAALLYAKMINKLIGIVDKKRGTNLSGEKALKIDPQFVTHFKGIDHSKVLFITGSNGKTTLTNLVTYLLTSQGKKVVANLEGANQLQGIATTLLKFSNLRGQIKDADYFVFETDERYLPSIYAQLPAESMVILDLQKDQVQRNGDPDFIIRKLRSFVNEKMTIYLNNDEPRSKAFEDVSSKVVYFGVEKHTTCFVKEETFPVMPCPHCDHKIEFEYHNNDSIGHFKCTHCGFSSNDQPTYLVDHVDFDSGTFMMNGISFNMPYNISFMLYNYSAALAIVSHCAGLKLEDVSKVFDGFVNVEGRFETLEYKNKTIKYMRIKQETPETLQSALDIIAADQSLKSVCFVFPPIADLVPYYTNTFYLWDCDFTGVVNANVDKYLCFFNPIAYDAANRLIYEGVEKEKIIVKNAGDVEMLFDVIDSFESNNIYLITLLGCFMKIKKYLEKGK